MVLSIIIVKVHLYCNKKCAVSCSRNHRIHSRINKFTNMRLFFPCTYPGHILDINDSPFDFKGLEVGVGDRFFFFFAFSCLVVGDI